MVELLKKIIHKSLGKLCSVQTVNAKCGMKKEGDRFSESVLRNHVLVKGAEL